MSDPRWSSSSSGSERSGTTERGREFRESMGEIEGYERLRESEQRYRTVLNSIDDGFLLADVVFDGEGEPLDVFYRDSNLAAIEMIGETFEGRWLTEIGTGYEAHWYEVFGRVASTGEGERHELYAEPDGSWYDFYVFKPEDAGSRRVAIVFQDITDRKQAEKELHESEERKRLALEAGEMGIWELDLRTNESPNRSPRHDEIFGYEKPLEDWSLETFLDHVHPEDRERIEASFEAAFEIGEWEFETRIVRADGEHRWIAARGEFFDDESEPVRAVGTVRDITKRKEQERRIERQHEQIETLQNRLLETSPTGILVMDSAGAITLANDRAKEIFEPAVGELVGLSYDELRFDLVDSNGEPIVNEELLFERAMQSGETVYGVEIGVKDSAGERVWLSVNVAPMYEDGEITEMVATIEDITERKRATESVERLNDATRELLEADAEAIRDQTADIARQVLDVELAALWAYDSASGDLKLYDSSTDQDTEIAGLKHPDGFDERAWTAFVTDEMGVDNDLPPAADITPSERPIRSGVIVPLGRHGVFCAGSTSPNAFDETRIDLAGTIAGTVETVLDRADNERQLAQQNEELTHLNRINAIIREIAQVLVETDTREAINRTVCERLAGSDLYAFAWIGQYDTRSNTVVPQEWAGVDSEYLEGLSIATDEGSTGPIGTALRTGELQVTEDILTDPTFAPWREETLAEGVRSCVAIPLVYEKSPYGVLTVYASCPQSDERDYTVLAELGETIAHAIDTVETKRTLQTDSVAELELRISAPEDVLCRLAGETGCRIEFEGLVPGSDGTAQIFFTARGASIEEILTHGAHSIAIEELTCLADHGENSAFKAVCSGRSLPMVLIERDGAIRSLSIDGDSGRAIIDLPATTETREFIETLQGQYPQTELLARRSRDRPATTRHELRTAFEERLTERQQEVLRTAYLSGFFESPRESTGQEVTASLGISQPTFIQHLRASQRKIFEMVFDET